jgi:hypothetical protein
VHEGVRLLWKERKEAEGRREQARRASQGREEETEREIVEELFLSMSSRYVSASDTPAEHIKLSFSPSHS